MNYCANKQHNAFGASENTRRSGSVNVPLAVSSDSRDSVVCPKPRRFGRLDDAINDPTVKPLRWRWHYNQQLDCCDSRAGTDLLDTILSNSMGSYGGEGQECVQEAWLPPVFSESPPCRVANPLVQDARFGKATSASPRSIPAVPSGLSSSQSPSSRTGGCMRGSFGAMPMVRVEGFDCVDKDGWNCSIPALA